MALIQNRGQRQLASNVKTACDTLTLISQAAAVQARLVVRYLIYIKMRACNLLVAAFTAGNALAFTFHTPVAHRTLRQTEVRGYLLPAQRAERDSLPGRALILGLHTEVLKNLF